MIIHYPVCFREALTGSASACDKNTPLSSVVENWLA